MGDVVTNGDEARFEPGSVLEAQIDLILNGFHGEGGLPDAAVWPPDWNTHGKDNVGDVDYLYRNHHILVRDEDVARVREIEPSEPVRDRESNLRGLTLLQLTDQERSVDEVCARLDRDLGEGIATPDHIFYVCTTATCPATEPEPVPGATAPDPDVETGPCDGHGVFVAVLDSGLVDDAGTQHSWLAGVTGDSEPIDPARIAPYAGHGTFVAGVVRTMAPRAEVEVRRTFRVAGANYESDLVSQFSQELRKGANIISLDFGTNTRRNIAALGFDVVGEQLKNYPGVVLVAAAGNDHSRRPFWPAAFCWAVGVGALSANWRHRANFSNYGPWVDVYAPGEGLVNAYANGEYWYTEPPNVGRHEQFDGMCRWSGTSFSTPMVAGLIAARMSGTGESAPQAAQSLLARAQSQAIRGVGPVLRPGQACDDGSGACCGDGSGQYGSGHSDGAPGHHHHHHRPR
jgi:subtilisin family serine protease